MSKESGMEQSHIEIQMVTQRTFFQNSDPIWLPHCPTCNVIISRGMSKVADQAMKFKPFVVCKRVSY